MASFAPVCPVSMMRIMMDLKVDVGNYHLLLAHEVLAHPDEYQSLFALMRTQGNPYIIMDNSVVELGEALPIDKLMQACDIVGADVLILPDVMGDMEATLEASVLAAHRIDRAYGPSIRLMGVVQGQTLSEAQECAEWFQNISEVSHLAVPKILGNTLGTRRDIIEFIDSELPWPVHMLGFSDNLEDDVHCAQLPSVTGIDSATPFWCDQLLPTFVTPTYRVPGGRPKNYWRPRVHVSSTMLYNYSLVKKWFKEGRA